MLTSTVPPDLVDEVIDTAGCREQRRRVLPARVVIYFVLALALFSAADGYRPPGYRAVARILVLRWRWLCHGCVLASSSALTQARQRLGVKPLHLLFDRVRGPAGTPTTGSTFVFGRRVVAWDATTLATPDTPANATEFGYHGQARNPTKKPTDSYQRRLGSTPLIRLMTLIDCGTHTIIDATFDGVVTSSEPALARRLLASLTPGMLLLADRNFTSHDLWSHATATGADLIWRAKKNLQLVPTTHLPDGSFLATLPTRRETARLNGARARGCPPQPPRHGHQIRVVEFTITTTGPNTSTEEYRLLTTLLDHHHAPAQHIAALYQQRWESETHYSFLKPRLIGTNTTLRSHTPTGITQEIYALLITYQALCHLRTEAATTANHDPDHISFTLTLRTARTALHQPPTHHTRNHTITDILNEPPLTRRHRTYPRQRRPTATPYPTKPRHQPRPPTHTHHHITITPSQTTTKITNQRLN
ncbi:IS4 family transposase [Micromonospora sp. NBC_01796]|uniref:IS4 family transposase n=1 Tax=Micromonospora sp. NBC_01796 TaxID=2975987 RepID=UPI002DD9EC0B|nr:IS4 family transposase [Micromonospora sp. NBC_01796]WSA83084.1 IS4 family transposase [Micromonospora sp. NBC_01796]